ncbi:MAG TPA: EVE domain-containing protein [Gemmatimonadetes bacterium]|jgi:predicted RNA-binding protein with PUA-like domain|nr:EVE domain-containing protein [Gemmatimonadota bacterium]
MKKSYWLMKSEPDVYSIDDLIADGRTHWDGVRNYQARNNMMKMAVGDEVLYYHSRQVPPAVVGRARVVKESYPDFTQFDKTSNYYDVRSSEEDPRWHMVDVEFVQKFETEIGLTEIKDQQPLVSMVLVNNSRLSVQPVLKEEFDWILKMSRSKL